MNFFNIGLPELMLIFIIALIFVGPRRLPEIGRSLGKIMMDLKQMSQEFTVDMMREMNAPAKENETEEIADQDASEKAADGDQG